MILAFGTNTKLLLFESLVQFMAQFKNSFRILFLREFFCDEAPKANGFVRRGIRHKSSGYSEKCISLRKKPYVWDPTQASANKRHMATAPVALPSPNHVRNVLAWNRHENQGARTYRAAKNLRMRSKPRSNSALEVA